MRVCGFFPMSGGDNEVLGVDLGPHLRGSAITGTPTVSGTNCTAAYVGHTPEGVVAVRVSAGTYAGQVLVTAALADGRAAARAVDLRFL